MPLIKDELHEAENKPFPSVNGTVLLEVYNSYTGPPSRLYEPDKLACLQ